MISEIALSYLENNNKSQKKNIFKNLIKIENILKSLNLPIKLNLNKKIETRNLYKKFFSMFFKIRRKSQINQSI